MNYNTISLTRCKCCLDDNALKSLWTEHNVNGEKEIYGFMLMECFSLDWKPPEDSVEKICESCIARLRDAAYFKQEIHDSVQLMVQLANENAESQEIKEESQNSSDDEIETEYLNVEYLDDDVDENVDKKDVTIKIENVKSKTRDRTPPSKRKKYTSEALAEAVEAVRSKEMNVAKAAAMYNIPRKTLSRNVDRFQVDLTKLEWKNGSAIFIQNDNLQCILKHTNATMFLGYLGKGYACYFCEIQFESPEDLKAHTIENHKQTIPILQVDFQLPVKLDMTDLKCKICNEEIEKYEEIIPHLQQHEIDVDTDVRMRVIPFKLNRDEISGRLKCVVCDQPFQFFKPLNDHMATHYGEYQCDICFRTYTTRNSLLCHKHRHETGKFTCRFCSKFFTTEISKRSHERSVHLLQHKGHKCGYCEEKFKSYTLKKSHEATNHGALLRMFKCNACGSLYKSQKALTKHTLSVHLLMKNHKCEHCGAEFFSKTELTEHIVKHTKTREFECGVCLKTFGRKNTLKRHMEIHKVDGYACEHCGICFVQKASLRKHVKTKHRR